MAWQTTSVLILRDFQIQALPEIPLAYRGRIDPNVWKEFTDQCVHHVNKTFSQSHDLSKLSSQRCCYQASYIICAPLVFILAYMAYFVSVSSLSAGSQGLLVLGAIIAIGALAAFVGALVTVSKCNALMREYRASCEQDLHQVFLYMNSRYQNIMYLEQARSTHRNNGKVQLGITVTLRVQQVSQSMVGAVPTVTNTGGAAVMQVMPIQMQQMQAQPVQFGNGQVVYQVVNPPAVQGAAPPYEYQPPAVPPPAYNANAAYEPGEDLEGGEGVANANDGGNVAGLYTNQ